MIPIIIAETAIGQYSRYEAIDRIARELELLIDEHADLDIEIRVSGGIRTITVHQARGQHAGDDMGDTG